MDTGLAHTYLVQITEPRAFLGGVIQTRDVEARLIVSVNDLANPNNSSSLNIPQTDREIFGHIDEVNTFSNGINIRRVYPPGDYEVSVTSSVPVIGSFVMVSEPDTVIFADVKDPYSNPRAAIWNGQHINYVGSLGQDDRGLRDFVTGKSQRLNDGFRRNDINHSGGFILPLSSGGLLVGHAGHNDNDIHCDYFAPGSDAFEPPTNSYILTNDSTSYPTVVELSDGKVFLYYRGTISTGTAHSATTIIFDPATGANPVFDSFVSVIGTPWRMYCASITHGIGADGKDYVGVVFNPRSFSSGRWEQLVAVVYCYQDNLWYTPDGNQIGSSTNGTDTNARTTIPIMQQAVGSGGGLLAKVTTFNSILADVQSGFVDVSQMPAKARGYIAYSEGDSQSRGGFGTFDINSLSFDGSTVHLHGPISTPSPAISLFNTFAVSPSDDGTLRLVMGVQTRKHYVNALPNEVVSPYYIGIGGGTDIYVYEVTDPYTATASEEFLWEENDVSVAQIRKVAGDDSLFSTTENFLNSPHPVTNPGRPIIIDYDNQRVLRSQTF